MTLGMFTILPLLKGWEWDTLFFRTFDMERGAEATEVRIEGIGWIAELAWGTYDFYATIELWSRPGRGQAQQRVGYWNPAAVEMSYAPETNLGYGQIFMKPSPTSTAGAYFLLCWAGWAHGGLIPFLDETVLKAYLPKESTQTSVAGTALMPIIRIKSVENFIRSMRAVEGSANMSLAPELIEFAQKYK